MGMRESLIRRNIMTNKARFVRKLLNGAVSVLLLLMLMRLFYYNDIILAELYSNLNTNHDCVDGVCHSAQFSQERLLFYDYLGNIFFRVVHFLLPVNIVNIYVWEWEFGGVANTGYFYSLFIVLFIVSSIVLALISKTKLVYFLYQVPLIVLVAIASPVFFESESVPIELVLALSCIFYGFSIYFLATGVRRKGLNRMLFGAILWLLPNFLLIAPFHPAA